MRITNESDYAVRIVYVLATKNGITSAKDISDISGVTLRFALKILRKLTGAGIVASQKGASGGYMLAKAAEEISLGEVIEVIDGPMCINNCIDSEFVCSRMGKNTGACKFHIYFDGLNAKLRKELYEAKLEDFLD